jgi:hypothetical protein
VSGSELRSAVARISLVYDVTLGVALLVAADRVATLFGMPVPEPRLFVTICGLLLLCVGLGYLPATRDPDRHTTYLWVFGPLLKGVGAAVFVWEVLMSGAPTSYLLFTVSDGTLAAVTLVALLRRTP